MIFLLRIQFLKLKNWLTRSTTGETFKTGGFALLGLLFLVLLYFGFVRVLTALRAVEIIGTLLLLKVLSMAFLTTFFMIVFSSALAAFTTLFFARDLSMLIHTPLPHRTLFFFKSLETAVFSSWMVMVALVPFLGAYGRVTGQGAGFYFLLMGLAVPFAWTASALGIGLSMTLMSVFPARRVREVMLTLAIVIGTGLFLWARWAAPARFVRADSLEAIVQYIAQLEAPTAPYLPSWWMSLAVSSYAAGRLGEVLSYGALLAAVAVAAGALLVAFGERAYYSGWAAAQEGGRRRTVTPLGAEWRWVPGFFGPRVRALLGKDFAIFRRDSNQWSQLLMLMSIVAVYLISIRKLPLDTPYLRGLVSFLNIGMVGFVLASVGLRFVFPEISLEGRAWWALRSAPMSLWSVLGGKFLSGFLPLSVAGVLLVWVSNKFLSVDPFIVWLSNGTVFVMAGALAGMGVGFGALFPRFNLENVAQIQTSAGGMIYMVAALFYVGLTLSLEAVIMRLYYYSRVAGRSLWSWEPVVLVAAALLAVNVVAVAGPLLLGKANLERADI